MTNWTIRHRLIAGIAIILSVIVAMGGFSLLGLRHVATAEEQLATDSLPGLLSSTELAFIWSADYALVKAYAASSDARAKERMRGEFGSRRSKIEEALARYQTTVFNAENRRLIENVQALLPAYLQARQAVLEESGAHLESGTSPTALLDLQFQRMTAALRDLHQYDSANARQSAQQISDKVAGAQLDIAAGIGAALVLAAVLGYLLLRSITRPLTRLLGTTEVISKGDFTQRIDLERRDEFGALAEAFDRMIIEISALVDQVQKSAIQVGTSVTEIVATANEQQATATQVAATTTEIGATSKEISATSKELVGTMNEVSAVAEQTANLAGNGQAGVARMEATMRQVAEAATSINARLVVLNEKAANINQVVTTITKVADQTNLLSLNAAIEAEKAGDAGRGFAVVATEIRRLADQTSVATYDIEQTVKEIQSAVAAGVMGMDKFSDEVRRGLADVQQVGDQLSQIIHQVQALAPRCVAVSEGMQAQSSGAEQISDALAQLTEASQQTVQSLRQSNDAIGGLNSVANALRGAIARFKLRTLSQNAAA
jgi:methyl-accepting chemotaxis protein WspA